MAAHADRLRSVWAPRAAWAALVVHLLAVVTVVGLASAGSRPLVPVPVRPLPDWVAGPLGSVVTLRRVDRGTIGLLLLVVVVSFLVTLALVDHLPRRVGLGAVVAVAAIVFVGPVLLSDDVFTYIDQGRLLGVHGLNPYRVGANAAPHDPTERFLYFHTGTSVYGPLFTLLAAAVAPLGLAGALWSLKAVALCSALAIVWLTAKLAARAGRSPTRAAVFVGLNPLFSLYTLGGAHNDLLALALGLGALTLVTSRPENLGWPALMVASAAIKATGGLLAPFALLAAARRGRALIAGAASAVVVAAIAIVAFGVHRWAGASLGVARGPSSDTSVPGFAAKLLTGHAHVPSGARTLITLTGLIAILYDLGRVARRLLDPVTGAGWAILVLLLTSTRLLPWYVALLLPPAAAGNSRRLRVAALVLTVYVVIRRLPG